MKIASFISDLRPSQMFTFNKQTTISKCVDAIQSEKKCILSSVDPDEGEVRVIYGAKKNANLKFHRWFFGTNSLNLIRFSFEEQTDGNTLVTATISREDGSQKFFDIGEFYEKLIKRIYSKM